MTDIKNDSIETSYLSYTKMILKKVSFDVNIFIKEFNKSKQVLSGDELYKLKKWCKQNFQDSTYHIL